ncbi:MAG: Rrf2 family transcriptional regulator [Elusimicrobia bacterium]|nr:Rrf2 family transcriptional regulator [Elusimicrobiota bacterium]
MAETLETLAGLPPLIELPLATRYAIGAAVWLSGQPPNVFFSIREVAKELGLPPDFLAKVFRRLLHKGLVDARRGPGGGYRLARSPEQIRLLDLAVSSASTAGAERDCVLYPHRCNGNCLAHAAVLSAAEMVREALARLTLADLRDDARAGGAGPLPETTEADGARKELAPIASNEP